VRGVQSVDDPIEKAKRIHRKPYKQKNLKNKNNKGN
jgi:hypothetical protein